MEKRVFNSGAVSDVGTRERLVTAAVDAFATHGFEGASVRLIERMAGVERGLVAYHFGTKDALWNQAVDSLWTTYVDQVVALLGHLKDVSPVERARAVLMQYVRFNAAHPQFFRILVAEGYQRTGRSDHLARHLSAGIEMWRTVLQLPDIEHQSITEAQTIEIYQILSAAGGAFAMAAYGEPVFGVDTSTSMFIEHFATMLARRLLV